MLRRGNGSELKNLMHYVLIDNLYDNNPSNIKKFNLEILII